MHRNGKTIDCSLSGATIFGLVIFRVGGKLDNICIIFI